MIQQCCQKVTIFRNSQPEVSRGKGVLKICSKFTGEHPCRNAILIRLQSNFTEITLRHGFSPVNLLHIFRASFLKNTSERLLLNVAAQGMIKPVVVPRKFYIRSDKNKVKSMKEGAQLLFNCFSEVIKRIAAHRAFLIIDKILSLLFYLYI